MTPEQIRAACADMPSKDEIDSFVAIMRGNLGNLSRREAFAAFHASLDIAIQIATELGANGAPSEIVAAFLLRECDADVGEACRAVRQAKARADAEVSRLRSRSV